MRTAIRDEIESIVPHDGLEESTRTGIIEWIDSGTELCRVRKPATPDKHLVSYVVVVDDDHVLLVDHKNAGLWLPAGGHFEPGEHPRETALREAREELAIHGEFLFDCPILSTSTITVGKTAGHIDVSICYCLRGNRNQDLAFDRSEFNAIRWFPKDSIPFARADPAMKRFLAKLCARVAA